MKIGYARVSFSGQHLDIQRTALTDSADGIQPFHERDREP